MKKITLLVTLLTINTLAWSQATTVTLFEENFDQPSGPDSVTVVKNPTTAVANWNDTNFISTSPNFSYHLQGDAATSANTWVSFETQTFSTVGNPYVLFTFNHIAKLFPTNRALIEISVDGGTTWDTLSSETYRGGSTNFGSGGGKVEYFQEGSYPTWQNGFVPNNTWWKTETFDLTGVASDTSTTPFSGYANVKLRFRGVFTFFAGAARAGWFIDDVEVLGNNCEVTPPSIVTNFTPNPCYANEPIGGIEADASLNGNYPVGVLATDTSSVFDTGVDSVVVVYEKKLSAGGWTTADTVKLPRFTAGKANEYKGFIPGLATGDTVRYFFLAFDLGCPNFARHPSLISANNGYNIFWITQNVPAKCGLPFCGLSAKVIQGDQGWSVDFEDPEWVAGNSNNVRGSFPTYPNDYWEIAPGPSQAQYGWSIRTGPTPGSPFTGPLGDHTPGQLGAGKYLYFETTGANFNNVSSLATPCIDLTQADSCTGFEFFYHMFGDDIGFIRVDIDTGSNQSAWYNRYKRIDAPVLNNQTDDWIRAAIDLKPFVGQIIKIRLTAYYRANGDRGDIAIDDMRIFTTKPKDLAAISQSYPLNGLCNYTSNQEIRFSFQNISCNGLDDAPVAFQVNYNGTWSQVYRDTIVNSGVTGYGDDTLDYAFTPATGLPDFTIPGTYQVRAWADWADDTDRSNDTAYGEVIEVYTPITQFPYVQDFENGIVGTQNLGSGELLFDDGDDPAFQWQVGEEMTPSENTGPFRGFYYTGKYLYSESNSSVANAKTYLRTVCVDLPSTMANPTLDFLYHMYGSDIVSLYVEVSREDEDIRTWNIIPGSTVTGSQTKELHDWSFKRVNLSQYAGESIKLRLVAQRSSGGDAADIAIDNLTIYDLISNDGGAYSITTPNKKSVLDTTQAPTVEFINYSNASISNFTVNLEVTPLCGPNQNVTTTYSETVTQNIPAGGTRPVTFNSNSWDWDNGEYRLTAYTSLNGDTYNFNDTISRNIIVFGNRFPIPFEDNFDACNYSRTGFTPGGPGLLQWELGTPTFGFGQSAYSSPNAWVTNLDGRFRVGETERLVLPLLNEFDTVSKAEIRFRHYIDMGNSGQIDAAGTVEYLYQGGYQAIGRGNASIGRNWMGTKYGTPSANALFGVNNPAFAFNSNGWIPSMYPLDEFNYFTSDFVTRFVFKSSNSMLPNSAGAGWAIDNFRIYVPPQNSVSPLRVSTVNPLIFPEIDQEFEITVINTGGKIVDTFYVDVYVDGQQVGQTYMHTAKNGFFRANVDSSQYPNDPRRWRYSPVERFIFPDKWQGANVTSGYREICVVTSRPNNVTDQLQADDTLCVTVPVFEEVDMRQNSPDSSYCNQFEGGNIVDWATTPVDFDPRAVSSWELGVPDTSQLDSAYSGNQVWMNYLDKNYELADQSALYSPIFLIDTGQTYVIDFWHWMQSEPLHDGGNVEFTEDGGNTWQHIGWAIDGKPWYSDQFVSALDQILPGWSGDTEGWENARLRIDFANATKLIFRMRFASDYDIEREGWAIDDWCFYKTNLNAEYNIGEEEMPLPKDEVIGLPSPNPAKNSSQISAVFPTPTEVNVNVVNTVGQLIENRQYDLSEGIHQFDFNTESWSTGVYFINIEFNGKLITRKLVIGH